MMTSTTHTDHTREEWNCHWQDNSPSKVKWIPPTGSDSQSGTLAGQFIEQDVGFCWYCILAIGQRYSEICHGKDFSIELNSAYLTCIYYQKWVIKKKTNCLFYFATNKCSCQTVNPIQPTCVLTHKFNITNNEQGFPSWENYFPALSKTSSWGMNQLGPTPYVLVHLSIIQYENVYDMFLWHQINNFSAFRASPQNSHTSTEQWKHKFFKE